MLQAGVLPLLVQSEQEVERPGLGFFWEKEARELKVWGIEIDKKVNVYLKEDWEKVKDGLVRG